MCVLVDRELTLGRRVGKSPRCREGREEVRRGNGQAGRRGKEKQKQRKVTNLMVMKLLI